MKVLRFFIYSNSVVSFSVGILAYTCAANIGNPHTIGIGLIAFFATLFIYTIQRLLRAHEVNRVSSKRHLWIENHAKLLWIASIISLILSIFIYFFDLGWNIDFWFLSISAVIGLLYAVKFLPKSRAIRDIPYIKIYLIAGQWSLVTVFWPYLRVSEFVNYPFGLGLAIFFYILAATVPFDIRDLVYDDTSKRTIPQLLGISGAKIAAVLFLLASVVFLSLFSKSIFNSTWFYISYIGMFILILGSKTTQKEMYYSGIIDLWITTLGITILLL